MLVGHGTYRVGLISKESSPDGVSPEPENPPHLSPHEGMGEFTNRPKR
jgi:hypothetical protein